MAANSLWYVRNTPIHADMDIPTVADNTACSLQPTHTGNHSTHHEQDSKDVSRGRDTTD
jgi:hypothetical protein